MKIEHDTDKRITVIIQSFGLETVRLDVDKDRGSVRYDHMFKFLPFAKHRELSFDEVNDIWFSFDYRRQGLRPMFLLKIRGTKTITLSDKLSDYKITIRHPSSILPEHSPEGQLAKQLAIMIGKPLV